MIVTFRSGETESLGMIEKVSYKVDGNSVLATSESGFAEGMTMRYTVIGPNTLKTPLGALKRVR